VKLSIFMSLALLATLTTSAAELPQKPGFLKMLVASRRCKDGQRGPAGGLNPLIPYIISPRSTSILNDKPRLRWNPVPNATTYKVVVEDERGNTLWETNARGSEVVYGGKPLEAGVDYSVIVEADSGKSSESDNSLEQGFRLLNADDAYQVRQVAGLLEKEKVSNNSAGIMLAHIYIRYDLSAEALATLEALAAKKSQTVAVYSLLGELYDGIGLNRLAESRYLEAVKLAEAAKDKQGLAAAQADLGEVYATRRNTESAIRWLKAAQEGYQVLGNRQQVMELKKRLEELNQQR